MNDHILTVEGLSKHFAEFSLEEVNFSLPAGYIMGLIGPNGSGKTTTISLILNKLKKDAGTVRMLGMDHEREELAVKERIGYVGDSCYFVKEWTVEQCGKSLELFYDSWKAETFVSCCRRFSLDPKKKVRELSKGMQMKLMISGVLSYDNNLLILDEPTSGLDPVSRDELLEILSDYIEDGTKSVLFSTHITSDLEKIADYVTFLRDGRVFYSGERQELLDSWVIAKGGQQELSGELRKKLTGLRTYSAGFEGLLPAWERKNYPGLVFDPVTLDDVIVFPQRTSEGGME